MSMFRFLLALLLLVPLTAQAQDFPKRDREPVVDAANLLNPAQKAEITKLAEDINKATTRQFVVATIPDLQGYDIADYGYRLGRAWGIGQKDANNGIILIVAPKERKVRIEVGYGLEPIMTDALSSSIINETILPKFRAKDVPGGIVAGAQAIAEQLKLPLEAAEAKAKAAADKAAATPRQARRSGGGFPFGLLFWGVILLFVLIPMIAFGRRRRGPWGARRYRGGGDDSGVLPILLWSIASEMSRGGGGSSGWGGSDGGSWGGGDGGGFSGGGGSFGGGGASGSW